MCEGCGCGDPEPRVNPAKLAQARINLRNRGIDTNAISDPDCYGTRSQKIGRWFGRLWFNFKIAAGWTW
ncbi:MAG TPA: hypothetical protein PK609_00490 [Candidatus Paceibacterota bacterium]|nr:hypothetical protein [Candidatus Paceibacterota bacterium]